MKKSVLVLAFVLGVVMAANTASAILINGIDVGDVDTLVDATKLDNSGNQEQAWITNLLGSGYSIEISDSSSADWATATIDGITYGAYGLSDSPTYYFIKLGAGKNDPPFTHLLFQNVAELQWAVVGLNFQWNGVDYEIKNFGKVSHVGSANPVPEPATMLLLGSGLAGLCLARKRKVA